jgi:carbon-monoxide dehydrogenase small subunit
MKQITLTINGKTVTADIDERLLLLEFIREVAGFTGTHNGCLEARCGCCAVEVDGDIVKSCNVLAVQVAGKFVTTVEGLSMQRLTPVERVAEGYAPIDVLGADPEDLHPVQAAFHRKHAVQCGFCTPGMVMVVKDFLDDVPDPSRSEVRKAICGNLCRCTGYQHIVDAAMDAAERIRMEGDVALVDAGGDG